ncbi:hypothetical protein CF319_g8983 [Tilletia indica]|uniref:Uncharacterized protein n=1 Tax=Tilletia indica TaxID=43049 RepID=A0A177TRC7_9BASI|nr:hypothetical protein CF319_g8983 [Tilletia indica]KAE8239795.1 hypothetical protein A4X13_0g8066 [Tilletia indica]
MDFREQSQHRFNDLVKGTFIIQKVGNSPMSVAFVSNSGWRGDCMIALIANLAWFEGWAKEMSRYEEWEKETTADDPKNGGIGTVPIGRVDTGVIKAGSGPLRVVQRHHRVHVRPWRQHRFQRQERLRHGHSPW